MCTRFFINDDVIQVSRALSDYRTAGAAAIRSGDIHPSEQALVLTGRRDAITAAALFWGFRRMDSRSLIVNARSETIHEKRMFQDSAAHRRCIIPAAGFYEWDAQKSIVQFTDEHAPVLFLAGLFQGARFTVLTTEANDSVRPIHPRMPVLIAENEIRDWLSDDQRYRELLKKPMPALARWQENEQLRLF